MYIIDHHCTSHSTPCHSFPLPCLTLNAITLLQLTCWIYISHYPTRFARFAAICSPLILILSGATPSPPSPWRATLTPPRALKWSRQRRCHGGRGRGWDEMDLVWPRRNPQRSRDVWKNGGKKWEKRDKTTGLSSFPLLGLLNGAVDPIIRNTLQWTIVVDIAHTHIYIYIITGLRQTLFEGDREGYISIIYIYIYTYVQIWYSCW